MKIVFDEPKRQANLRKHGLDFGDLTSTFFEIAAIVPAKLRRFCAFGVLNDRMIAVVFKPLGEEAVSVISMRPAKKKERSLHAH